MDASLNSKIFFYNNVIKITFHLLSFIIIYQKINKQFCFNICKMKFLIVTFQQPKNIFQHNEHSERDSSIGIEWGWLRFHREKQPSNSPS